jgi:tetratricopeptide (TPR) repeat protein
VERYALHIGDGGTGKISYFGDEVTFYLSLKISARDHIIFIDNTGQIQYICPKGKPKRNERFYLIKDPLSHALIGVLVGEKIDQVSHLKKLSKKRRIVLCGVDILKGRCTRDLGWVKIAKKSYLIADAQAVGGKGDILMENAVPIYMLGEETRPEVFRKENGEVDFATKGSLDCVITDSRGRAYNLKLAHGPALVSFAYERRYDGKIVVLRSDDWGCEYSYDNYNIRQSVDWGRCAELKEGREPVNEYEFRVKRRLSGRVMGSWLDRIPPDHRGRGIIFTGFELGGDKHVWFAGLEKPLYVPRGLDDCRAVIKVTWEICLEVFNKDGVAVGYRRYGLDGTAKSEFIYYQSKIIRLRYYINKEDAAIFAFQIEYNIDYYRDIPLRMRKGRRPSAMLGRADVIYHQGMNPKEHIPLMQNGKKAILERIKKSTSKKAGQKKALETLEEEYGINYFQDISPRVTKHNSPFSILLKANTIAEEGFNPKEHVYLMKVKKENILEKLERIRKIVYETTAFLGGKDFRFTAGQVPLSNLRAANTFSNICKQVIEFNRKADSDLVLAPGYFKRELLMSLTRGDQWLSLFRKQAKDEVRRRLSEMKNRSADWVFVADFEKIKRLPELELDALLFRLNRGDKSVISDTVLAYVPLIRELLYGFFHGNRAAAVSYWSVAYLALEEVISNFHGTRAGLETAIRIQVNRAILKEYRPDYQYSEFGADSSLFNFISARNYFTRIGAEGHCPSILNPEDIILVKEEAVMLKSMDEARERVPLGSTASPVTNAEHDLNQLIKNCLKYGKAHNKKGEYDKAIGVYSQVISVVERAMRIVPQRIWILYFYRAICLTRLKKNTEAVPDYERAHKLNPEIFEICLNLGKTYYWLNQYDEAIEMLGKSLKIDNSAAWPHYYLGEAYFAKKYYSKALKAYLEAKKRGVNHNNMLERLGDIYYKDRNYNYAREHYIKALRIAYLRLRRCRNDGPGFENTLKPVCAHLFLKLGNTFFELKYYSKAVKCYTKTLKITPKSYVTLYRLSRVYFVLGERKKGIQCEEKGHKLNPDYCAVTRKNASPIESNSVEKNRVRSPQSTNTDSKVASPVKKGRPLRRVKKKVWDNIIRESRHTSLQHKENILRGHADRNYVEAFEEWKRLRVKKIESLTKETNLSIPDQWKLIRTYYLLRDYKSVKKVSEDVFNGQSLNPVYRRKILNLLCFIYFSEGDIQQAFTYNEKVRLLSVTPEEKTEFFENKCKLLLSAGRFEDVYEYIDNRRSRIEDWLFYKWLYRAQMVEAIKVLVQQGAAVGSDFLRKKIKELHRQKKIFTRNHFYIVAKDWFICMRPSAERQDLKNFFCDIQDPGHIYQHTFRPVVNDFINFFPLEYTISDIDECFEELKEKARRGQTVMFYPNGRKIKQLRRRKVVTYCQNKYTGSRIRMLLNGYTGILGSTYPTMMRRMITWYDDAWTLDNINPLVSLCSAGWAKNLGPARIRASDLLGVLERSSLLRKLNNPIEEETLFWWVLENQREPLVRRGHTVICQCPDWHNNPHAELFAEYKIQQFSYNNRTTELFIPYKLHESLPAAAASPVREKTCSAVFRKENGEVDFATKGSFREAGSVDCVITDSRGRAYNLRRW